ncbi:U1 small nuclear ribonucleoprotein of 70kDa MW N terminal-domain-containing protein [Podospora conica]|nr:U1 small nuclear ribonucleoprotein of 70kDa MW N terminal-domain-containing protein [Schizothecium conicum]
MTDKLPPNLLALFAPRPPLRWVPPCDQAPEKRKTAPIDGVAAFLPSLAQYEREYEYHPTESWLEKRDRKIREKKEAAEKLIAEAPKLYNPNEDPNIRGDAFKTCIVARLDYKADEQDLEREFGRFGTIERIRLIKDTHADEKGNKKRKPHRGYAFIVFEREKDMRDPTRRLHGPAPPGLMALKLACPGNPGPPFHPPLAHVAIENCDGIRIKDRRIKVDVERGRTVKGWKPRRLGGGLGGRGYTKAMPARPMGPGGGFGGPGGFRGGGFGGGFRGRDRGFRGGGGGFGDRAGGGGFGDRGGGFGDRGGGGGFRGGFGGPRSDRNFSGPNGVPPSGAPSGPGGDRGDRGFGDRSSSFGGRDDRRGGGGMGGGYGRDGGRSYDDRSGGGGFRDRGSGNPRQSGSNMEPIRPRGENGGYSDRGGGGRDYDRPRDHDKPRDYDDSRKRGYEGGQEDPRKLRRY